MSVVLSDSRHKAVWDWLMTCPHIGDLFFAASRAEDGDTQLIPSEDQIEDYIDGSKKMRYTCALTRFMPYSVDPNDDMNMTYLISFESIADWIEEQIEAGNVPQLPDGYTLTDVNVLPNGSGWVVAQDMTTAKYMIQFQIEYIRERTVHATGTGQ